MANSKPIKMKFLRLFGIIIFMFGMIASTLYHSATADINWIDFVLGAITGAGLGLALGLLRRG